MPLEKRPHNPVPRELPPGRRHPVSDGESFASIAAAYGISAKQLILHNFGTTDPMEINWYLHHHVGCVKQTADGKNWMFSAGAKNRHISIPDQPGPPRPPSPPPAAAAPEPPKPKTDAEKAFDLIEAFSKKTEPGAFPHLSRAAIASQLAARVTKPYLINQAQTGTCPVASFAFSVASTQPLAYVQAVMDLFDTGRARIGKFDLAPGYDLRQYMPPKEAEIADADWILLASIRDTDNWFFDYQDYTDNGGGWGWEIERWFKRAGYTDVQADWNMLANKGVDNLKKANELFETHQVCLLIDADLIKGKSAIISRPNHWVCMVGKAQFTTGSAPVSMWIFTWGERRPIPGGSTKMNLDDFLDHYYGYVAARF